ncbi:MAG TPA: tRNA pseudouridine(55) synthase TruB [Luteitalea sp.]|nr:tRNA pseudouridine(55) synthase TruB [Luteitalea sp.]
MTRDLDGVLVVDKAAGMTSHDVVAAIRRRLPRGTRVGHTGTLDPFATGVLPIVIGKATRLSQFLLSSQKQYVATVAFDAETDTGDATGTVVVQSDAGALATLDEAGLEAVLPSFVGTHPQVPPAHSAKKVDGERAYELARRGEVVELAAVDVTAHAVALVSWDADARRADIRLTTSAGYYVRSFARDLGRALGVAAHLTALRRTASGEFALEAARPLDVLLGDGGRVDDAVLPMVSLLSHLPSVEIDETQVAGIRQGRPVRCAPADSERAAEGRVRLVSAGSLVALARPLPGQPGLLHADIVLV